MAESLYPPHSRLFVSCDRDSTEEEIIEAFQQYGTVANVNLCRDRVSGEPKGFAFVQFDKTSEAAAALEGLNGAKIGRSSRPIKVSVALAKDQNTANSDPSQFLRLFLVVPKTSTEDDLYNHFSQFGQVDKVNIVKDRQTKLNKGYAYVAFKKFFDAAVAYESCDRMYKVVFAKPKDQALPTRPQDGYPLAAGYNEPVQGCTHIDDNPEGYTSLRGLVSTGLTDAQVEWLFDIPPGFKYMRFFNDPAFLGYDSSLKRKVLAHYDSPGTAAYALRKLDGFEFPSGERVVVKPDYQSHDMDRSSYQGGAPQPQLSVTDLMQKIETLNKSLSEATRIITDAGLHAPTGKTIGQIEAFRCSARLPPPQPLAPPNSNSLERLFLVCEPGLPPQDALWDVFSRFGNLIGLYILNGKNCGYVKYANKLSAQRAMNTLNGEDLYRMKLKVMIAEPQRESVKRPRINDY